MRIVRGANLRWLCTNDRCPCAGEVQIETRMETRSIDVSDFMPGDYELEITVTGRRGRVFNKRVESFELNLTAESMFKNDYEMAIKMLKYLASRDESKKFKK